MSQTRPRVAVIGGGYAAINAVRKLRPSIGRGEVDVTVIDKNNYQTFHGLIAEMLVGKLQPGQILSPARKLFHPAHFHNALIEQIDPARQEIVTGRALDGRQHTVPYDYLVMAIGTVDDLSRYPGISEHAIKLKNYWDCFRLRSHVLRMMEMAEYEAEAEERQRLLTFVVAGGNYAGVEVASELIVYLRDLTRRHYPRVRPEEIRIVIVHNGPCLLPELGKRFPKLTAYASRHLEALGLDIVLGARVASATPAEVFLDNGQKIASRTLVSCTGTAQSPLLDQIGGERDGRGRLVTDANCQVKGLSGVWAAGDCAAVPDPVEGYYPQLAIYAIEAGKQVGRNISRVVRGQPQRPVRFRGFGDACSLGGGRAVAQLKGVPLKGRLAWMLWRGFALAYLPTWDRRVRTMFDWISGPIIGRDIVCVETDQQIGLSAARFEPGQVIIREGDTGRDMFIIQEGKVTVERGGKTIGTLAAGRHFGERAVFSHVRRTASVRAQTVVKVLVIKRDDAQMLESSLGGFEEMRRAPTFEQG